MDHQHITDWPIAGHPAGGGNPAPAQGEEGNSLPVNDAVLALVLQVSENHFFG